MKASALSYPSGHWGLVLICVGLVVYASLFPFAGWRDLGVDWWTFLIQPRPRYWTGFDVGINLAGYMPLGFLLALSLKPRGSWRRAVVVACAAASALSLLLEGAQQFIPGRVASNADWVFNTVGGLLGAQVAWAMDRSGWSGALVGLRRQWLVEDARTGLYLMLAWPLALLFPSSVVLGLGQVAERLHRFLLSGQFADDLEDWLPDLSIWDGIGLSPVAEVLVVATGLWLPMLLLTSLVRRTGPRVVALAAVAVLAWVACSLSAALSYGPAHAWVWWTPATQVGWALAVALALPTTVWSQRVLWALALVAGLCGLALVNPLAGNGYLAYNLVAWEQGQFVRFHGLAQWLGWLWPYLALFYIFHRLSRE